MNLLHQLNNWSCLPTSLAMLLEVPLKEVLQKIGHDGSEILFPTLPDPIGRRGFTIEEIQYVTPSYGVFLIRYVPGLIYQPSSGCAREYSYREPFINRMKKMDGLLFGTPIGKQLDHVVAWSASEELAYDPNGTVYNPSGRITIETFYGLIRC